LQAYNAEHFCPIFCTFPHFLWPKSCALI